MTNQWQKRAFTYAFVLNPRVNLERNVECAFVEMAAVESTGYIKNISSRTFTGSGSRFEIGDTLFARITPCLENGKIARIMDLGEHQKGFGSTEFIVIRGRNGVSDSAFAYYLAISPRLRNYAVSQMTGTSGRQRVPVSAFDAFEVELPPLHEQREIAAILGSLDDKIDLNRRMNSTLEAIARAIFQSWFVDFYPVRAKAEGRQPDGMDAETAALFPDRFEESPLGLIPRGWTVAEMSEKSTLVRGVSYRSDELKGSSSALVSLKSINRGGGYSHGGLKPYIGKFKESQVLANGDVIIAHTDVTQAAEVLGCAARVQTNPDFERLVASLDLAIVRPHEPLTNEYVYLLLSRPEFRDHALGFSNGTTVLHLSNQALPTFRFVLPTSNLVRAFTRRVTAIFQEIDVNTLESRTLAETRDVLLSKLVSGEVRLG